MNCRLCNHHLSQEFLDLGNAPPSNAFLTKEQLNAPEIFYPLKLWVCDKCFLVQIDELKSHHEIFHESYAYFSSYSSSWLNHARQYVNMITARLALGPSSQVIEIASNDGYLLQYVKEKQIRCIGIEPSSNTAQVCKAKHIPVIEDFFNSELAATLPKADLIIGNNVLAHVPDIHDFAAGLKIALKKEGTITLEFPHFLRLIEQNQFDTIYHEHFSYFSLHTAKQLFAAHDLEIYDVEELPTHGGSLRIYIKHRNAQHNGNSSNIARLLLIEQSHQLHNLAGYQNFQLYVNHIKNIFLTFLLKAKREERSVIGYGAAAKGNTLLNYCGIKKDLITCVADLSPHKQGHFLPGSHLSVVSPKAIMRLKPDYVIIFPWNIKDEIMNELAYINQWGGEFVVPIPELEIIRPVPSS